MTTADAQPQDEQKGPPNLNSWTCFHCAETFTTIGSARDHFGGVEGAEPGCLIEYRVALEQGGKPERGRGLQMALRKAESALSESRLQRDTALKERDMAQRELQD
jgi:hypothetical protein